ncbi:hypothetical protein [Pseudoalteromonas sp. McH1-42]|uniref:hypothetical protein n=1 Tax=Pseudoalteromonas sp. McH1-42 TaxID=2917752 RepID=UPI001EF701E6|nr:hypothetical protein [Pseudoalteromonas sp. McH1-42]MCG7563127.1 hypothetical protein [Pseudoalteromonas sp. McH1-42]
MLVRSHANGVACWQFPHQVWDDGGAGFMIGKLYNFFKSHKAKNPQHRFAAIVQSRALARPLRKVK